MRLLEIGMGCSVHGGVNGLNTLSVSPSLSDPLYQTALCKFRARGYITYLYYQSIGATRQLSKDCCLQLWRKYLTNTKVSFVENDAACARRHKAEIEAVAKGKVYVGKLFMPAPLALQQPPKATAAFGNLSRCHEQ